MRQYEVVISAPYCCVCAVIESILKRHGFQQTQYDLANFAGLVVPDDELENLPKELTNLSTSNVVLDYGIHLYSDTLNSFFQANGIPLRETYICPGYLSDMNFEDVLKSTSEEFDVLLLFDYGVLHNEERSRNVGHCVLYLSQEDRHLTYLDPGPRCMGVNTADIDDMLSAIKARKNGGISIISPLV